MSKASKNNLKVGFIGVGNMASAMVRSLLRVGVCNTGDVCGSCLHKESAARMCEELEISVGTSNEDVVLKSDVVFLTCKPYQYESVCAEIRSSVQSEQIIVSVAPGITRSQLKSMFSGAQNSSTSGEQNSGTSDQNAQNSTPEIIRCMPNTPAQVGEGTTSYCADEHTGTETIDTIEKIFGAFGSVEKINEDQMDAATALGGSSPAFVYAFIEALADGGVACGLPRAQAQRIAAQTVLGSAKMVLETGKHPGVLKDAVCSPAGTTIKGLASLERNAFRGSIITAICETAAAAKGD